MKSHPASRSAPQRRPFRAADRSRTRHHGRSSSESDHPERPTAPSSLMCSTIITVEFTTSRAVQLFAEDVLHRILDLLASLLDVTLGLVALALYLKPRIISDPAGGFLRLALEHLSLVLNLVAGSHTSLPVVGRVETKYPKV